MTDQPRQGSQQSLESLKQATIMMVDDEPITMDIVRMSLEDAGYKRFILVERSTEAMDVLRNELPDVLLLDLRMPEVTGFDILKEMRADSRLVHVPVIVLTSSTGSDTKLQVLELGATDFLSKPVDASELILRLRNTLAAKAYQDQLAYYDSLTNLPNRRMFHERLVWALQLARREGRLCALLHVGIDRFREVNEAMGPQVGDELLRGVAKRMQQSLRDVDALGNFSTDARSPELSRLGGDEFSVVLNGIHDPIEAGSVARRLVECIRQPFSIEGREVFVTPSIGIAVFPEDGDDAEALLKNSASATSFQKQKGGANYQYYSIEINSKSASRLSLEYDLHRAIERSELRLCYQAKICGKSGTVKGSEALLRWEHGERGTISPLEFVPIAERANLIIPIGEWVMHEACRQNRAWHEAGLEGLSVSVNVSAPQMHDPDFVARVKGVLEQTGLDPRYLVIELTESILMGDAEQNYERLLAVKEMGVRVSIDDFGTGYSSLSYLKRFPLDELKIDRSFVCDIDVNPEDSAIVDAILALSHSLGLSVVAEGVETDPIRDALVEKGCDLWQGFLWSKPLPPDDAVTRIHAWNSGKP